MLGERFTAYLKFKGLSQKKVSSLSGVTESTLSRFLSGGVITSDKLARILMVCPDLSLEWFFFGVGEMIRKTDGDRFVNSGMYAGAEVLTDQSVNIKDSRGVNVSHGLDEHYFRALAEKDRIIVEKDRTISERDRTIRDLLSKLKD